MSQRDYAWLWLGASKTVVGGGGGVTASGGSVLLKAPRHKLDGPEHITADDTTTLDSTTSQHGLLPKLSGNATDVLDGTGAFRAEGSSLTLDSLSDVVITSASAGDRLRFNGTNWVNSALVWRPAMVLDPTSGNYLPMTTGSGDAVMVEA